MSRSDRLEDSPRTLVAESWQRSLDRRLDPERLLPVLELARDDVVGFRSEHPLAALFPVVRSLLLDDVEGAGLLVAIGDADGRLLWVEGDATAKRSAEDMRFVEGAGWAESRVGTSAPGTALVLDRGVQIRGDEHFNTLVKGWSCSAVPIHDPVTGRILGFVDITGDERAVGPHTLTLLEATVRAMESELMVSHLRERGVRRRQTSASTIPLAPTAPSRRLGVTSGPQASRGTSPALTLSVLGRDVALLSDGRRLVPLSARHSEIMTLLAWHSSGLSADELAHLVYGDEAAVVTLRSEMVRLRHALDVIDPRFAPLSRPYRLPVPPASDVRQMIALLDRGAHRQALQRYVGPILPNSTSPGIAEIRESLRMRVRESLLSDASVDVLLEYAASSEGETDVGVLMAALSLLPARSPRRAGIVARLELLDRL